jgi:excisionase family DNA binding protein
MSARDPVDEYSEQERESYSTGEAARILGVSFITIKRWIYAGRISATRQTSGRYRIGSAELARLKRELRDQHSDEIISVLASKQVCYLRELQISLETKYPHDVTVDKVGSLVSSGAVLTEKYRNYRWYYSSGTSWSSLQGLADSKVELAQFYENYPKRFEKDGIVYMDYSEYLVEQALIRAGFFVVAKDSYYFNGLVYRRSAGPGRPPDLDFIAKLPGSDVFVGIQIKNRLEPPRSDAVNELIDICRHLQLKPLLITRVAHPTAFLPVSNLGGYVLVCERYFLQPEFPRDKFDAIVKMGIPLGVYRYGPDFLIRALTRAARSMR